MYLCINGKFVTKEEAAVSPFDHGFMYGMGLFETFRTYGGHPFLLDDHFHRLHESAEEMNIVLPAYSRAEVTNTIKELLRLNGLPDGYIRWNISAGTGDIGLATEPYTDPVTTVYMKPLAGSTAEEKEAKTLSVRRNTPEGAYRLKSHHYFNSILGKREAGAASGTEGIFLTEDGCLSEGVVSNLFWVKGGCVYTPDLSCGCLNGITRQFLLALFKKMDIRFREGRYKAEEALSAEEVFVTNSVQEVTGIDKWDDRIFPGSGGSMFRQIKDEYKRYRKTLWSRDEIQNFTGKGD